MIGFRHTDTSNSVSAFQMSINRQLITFWLHQVPETEEDFHTQIDALSISMNISRNDAKNGLRVGVMLRNFQNCCLVYRLIGTLICRGL